MRGEWNQSICLSSESKKFVLDAVEEKFQHPVSRSSFDPSAVPFGNVFEQPVFTTGESLAPSTIWNRVPGTSLLNSNKDTYQLEVGAKDKRSGFKVHIVQKVTEKGYVSCAPGATMRRNTFLIPMTLKSDIPASPSA